MIAEVAALCRHIPHRDLCIQWDVCNEMVVWDGQKTDAVPFADEPRDKIIARMQRLCAAMPDDVELGLHLCYGDFGGKHFVEPKDAARDGRFRQCAVARDRRTSSPTSTCRCRSTAATTRSTGRCAISSSTAGTALFLGVVHAKDGAEGTKARIAAAQRYAPEFGIATECGMARARSEEIVRSLLKIHADLLRLTAQSAEK